MRRRDFLKLPAAAFAPQRTPVEQPVWHVHLLRREPNPFNAQLFPGMGIATATHRVTVSYEEDLSDIDWEHYRLIKKERFDVLAKDH